MTFDILTCAEIAACEARACAGETTTLAGLMQRAGEACAEAFLRRFGRARAVVLVGPGNNGGDALVAARRLVDQGGDVVVYEIALTRPRSAEASLASEAWSGPRHPLSALALQPGDVVIDGLFGAGLSRPLGGEAAAAVAIVNDAECPVLAIDVPSGVAGDGQRLGGDLIQATVSIAFGAKKPAHILQPFAAACGDVEVVEIGFGAEIGAVSQGRLRENDPTLWRDRWVWPTPASHKHARGRLAVVTGGLAATGAARLAAQAGLRIGAGAVTLLCPPEALLVVAGASSAVMTAAFDDEIALAALTDRSDAVVIGPAAGVHEATRRRVEALIASRRRLVLDADGLSVFAGDVDALAQIAACDAVLTPHAGEFERVFPGLLAGAKNRIEAARVAAAVVGAVVLLKGADTVVAAPDGRAVVNTHASPFLATAGSGDVLAGVIGGLMAQGVDPFEAACAGAWAHGDAGLRLGAGLTAEDLDRGLAATIAALYLDRPRTRTGRRASGFPGPV